MNKSLSCTPIVRERKRDRKKGGKFIRSERYNISYYGRHVFIKIVREKRSQTRRRLRPPVAICHHPVALGSVAAVVAREGETVVVRRELPGPAALAHDERGDDAEAVRERRALQRVEAVLDGL